MQDQNARTRATEPKSRLVDPTKAAFAATVFAASVVLSGCSTAASNNPYCSPNPTTGELQAMSDERVRECLEAADRERHSSYGLYHGYYVGRGFGYTPGAYATPSSSGSHFVAPKSGGYSSGSSYKSGGGGSFSGSKSSGSAIS